MGDYRAASPPLLAPAVSPPIRVPSIIIFAIIITNTVGHCGHHHHHSNHHHHQHYVVIITIIITNTIVVIIIIITIRSEGALILWRFQAKTAG